MQGLTALSGPQQNVGMAPAPTAASSMSMPAAQGLQGLSFITNDLPESWLTPDLQSGTIDWNMFNPINIGNYEAILNTAYKPKPSAPKKPVQPPNGLASFMRAGPAVNAPRVGASKAQYGYFNKPPEAAKAPVFKGVDLASLRASMGGNSGNGLMDAVYNTQKHQYDQDMKRMAYVGSDALTFRDEAINNAIKALDINTRYASQGKLNEADIAERDKRIGDVSSKYGMSSDDLKRYLGQYDKALSTLADPVGANWQDLKRTGDFYKNQVLPGVRRFSGYNDAFFANLNSQASEGTRNSQKYLDPEYYALHTVTPNVQQLPGVKQGELIGTINPKLGAWYKDGYNSNPGIDQGRKDAGHGYSKPYSMSDWQDYLDSGVSRFDATDEQKKQAQERYSKYMDFLDNKVADGGQFNLWREMGSDVDPYKVTKTKGGKWKPRNSGYTNQLNIAQNFLPQASEGKKTFEDLGYNVDDAYKSGFYFEKKKKKGLLGGGLGALLSLASFIPGPVGIGARIASAANAAASGDALGAIMSGIGAYGNISGTNVLGSFADKIGGTLGVSPNIANSILSGGIGGLGAISNGGNFLTGALGGGLGTFATGELGNILSSQGLSPTMAGALSGAAGSALQGGIIGAKGPQLGLGVAQGAISGYGRGRNIARRRQNVRRT